MIARDGSFVFVHVPKTAGNTISMLLAPYCGDVLYSGAPFQDGRERFSVRNASYPTLHKHSTLAEYALAMGQDFAQVLAVCCVRDPWERAVSMYFSPSSVYARTVRPDPHPSPADWDRAEFVRMLADHVPSHRYVELPDQTSPWKRVDVVIRFENLEEDLGLAFRALGLRGCPQVPRLNASHHALYPVFYDDELISLVASLEAPLIEKFGYSPRP